MRFFVVINVNYGELWKELLKYSLLSFNVFEPDEWERGSERAQSKKKKTTNKKCRELWGMARMPLARFFFKKNKKSHFESLCVLYFAFVIFFPSIFRLKKRTLSRVKNLLSKEAHFKKGLSWDSHLLLMQLCHVFMLKSDFKWPRMFSLLDPLIRLSFQFQRSHSVRRIKLR